MRTIAAVIFAVLAWSQLAMAAPLDAWGAAQCEPITVGPTPAAPCADRWEPIVSAVGDASLDWEAGTLSVHGTLTLASGRTVSVATDAVLVDADAGFSGLARVLIDGNLLEVQLEHTASGWLEVGSPDLGYYVRAPW